MKISIFLVKEIATLLKVMRLSKKLLKVCDRVIFVLDHVIVLGNDTLNHRYIALKRVSKSQASKAVYDVEVFRSKDNPASSFTKLGA